MGRPKNWDTMTIEAQDAWRERKRIYERTAPNRVKAKTIERKKVWQQENRDKARASYLKYSEANKEKISANQRNKYNANPKVIEKRLMKKEIQEDLEKIERRRKLNAQNQRNRYARNREKVLAQKNEWRIKNKEKVMASANESVYREHLAEMKASGKKVEPAKLDMSKVLAFISKKDGPKSQKPITPNMAKVREFIKYA